MAARKTRRQLQFTGFEMTLIAASFVVTVTVVFFLGLFVGKKNASHHAPAEDRVARVPVEDFSRYKRPTAAAKAAAPSTDEGRDGKATAPASGSGGAESARKQAQPPAPAKPATASQETAKAEASKKAAAKETATKEAAAKPEATTGHGYTVQILATRREADADALVRKLKSRGYAAYIKKISDGAGAWYRVRVGSFGAFSEARVMADKCRHDLGLGQAFVSTE